MLGYSSVAVGDLPLKIEDMITAQKRYSLEVGLIYANRDEWRAGAQTRLFQLAPGEFVRLPVEVGEGRRNSDTFISTFGLRYGLNKKSEVFSRISMVSDFTRFEQPENTGGDSRQRLANWIAGYTHRFSDDNDTPAFLGFGELMLVENSSWGSPELAWLKGLRVGFTSYRSIDPVVLSLSGGYLFTAEREEGDEAVDPGDLVYFNPSVAFAVNNRVSLTGGVQLRWRGKERVDGEPIGIDTTETRLNLGVGFAPNKRTILAVDTRIDISGNNGAEVGLTLRYKLWDPQSIREKLAEELKRRKREKTGGE